MKAQTRDFDLALTNVYPASSGQIMVTIKNGGNVVVTGSYKVGCNASYLDSGGWEYPPLTSHSPNLNLQPGAQVDVDTGYARNPSIQLMYVGCRIYPPSDDSNAGNNTLATQVK